MYQKILIPTDGSERSLVAADHAIDLAKTYNAELHTVYVVETDLVPDTGLGAVIDALERVGEEAVAEVTEKAEQAGASSVTGHVRRGTPHRQILEYVDEHDIDLVVMGTHGRTGLSRYLLGSVTEKVVRAADIPVMTVSGPATSVDH